MRDVNHNNHVFHPLGKLVPSRSDMAVGRARVLPWLLCTYIEFQRLSVECLDAEIEPALIFSNTAIVLPKNSDGTSLSS